MGQDAPHNDVFTEITHCVTDVDSGRCEIPTDDSRHVEARRQLPATAALSNGEIDNPAVAVLEHIYRDMIAALQQMYGDTIAAKDDALTGRDRELETKDALI